MRLGGASLVADLDTHDLWRNDGGEPDAIAVRVLNRVRYELVGEQGEVTADLAGNGGSQLFDPIPSLMWSLVVTGKFEVTTGELHG